MKNREMTGRIPISVFASLVVLFFFFSPTLHGFQQNARQENAEGVANGLPTADFDTIVFNDLFAVQDDIVRLVEDLGFAEQRGQIEPFVRPNMIEGVDFTQGLAIQNFIDGGFRDDRIAYSFVVDDWDAFVRAVDGQPMESSIDGVELLSVGRNIEYASFFLRSREGATIATRDRKSVTVVEEGQDDAVLRVFALAPMLSDVLDSEGTNNVNQSGISFVYDLEAFASEAGKADIDDLDVETWGPAERAWTERLLDGLRHSWKGIIGLRYREDKQFDLRLRLQLDDEGSFEGLYSPDAPSDWSPTRGLPRENLLLSLGIQMEAFPDSGAPRALPHVLSSVARQSPQSRPFSGAMLRVLGELCADSWNDLNVARVGLYGSPEDDASSGLLNVVGVVDARDSASVMDELRHLSTLTSPMELAAAKDAFEDEVIRLLSELGSSNPSLVGRAETRLRLAGKRALPIITERIESLSPKAAERAERILKQLRNQVEAKSDEATFREPDFWTTLNPGLELIEDTGHVGDYVSHTIRITPDPDKSDDQVAKASATMASLFGEGWNEAQVVEVDRHLVFLMGSNRDVLAAAVEAVANEADPVGESYPAGMFPAESAPVQLFLDAGKLAVLYGDAWWDNEFAETRAESDRMARIGLHFQPQAVEVDVMVPIHHIIPFVSGVLR